MKFSKKSMIDWLPPITFLADHAFVFFVYTRQMENFVVLFEGKIYDVNKYS